MQLYPAIDLRDGKCVRLTQGEFNRVKVYSDSPAEMAKHWESLGATYLHLVDLDGALAGKSINEGAIREIIRSVSIPVQLGGGIRSEEAVKHLLSLGVSRVIIGTKAVNNPEFIKRLTEIFGSEQIVVGVDAKNGFVATHGWEQVSDLPALDLCNRMAACGVKHVVYTDISKDGMLAGPNVAETKKLTMETGLDIIASGGVSCMEDLKNLFEAGIQGAIIGKALYETRVDLKQAVSMYEKVKGEPS